MINGREDEKVQDAVIALRKQFPKSAVSGISADFSVKGQVEALSDKLKSNPLITQIPLQYLASRFGMTPETFSRIRRKMVS